MRTKVSLQEQEQPDRTVLDGITIIVADIDIDESGVWSEGPRDIAREIMRFLASIGADFSE